MLPEANKNPYYIFAPPYRSVSAGIKGLYLLCHYLNLKGYRAYIAVNQDLGCNKEFDDLFYSLNCPILDSDTLEFHQKNNYNPIVIYPDTVDGNPLKAKNVVRYMLNYSNLFGQFKINDDEFIIAYTKKIADSLDIDQNRVLFIPASNTNIFYPPKENSPRSGSCVYLGKYYDFHKGDLDPITKNSIPITRGGPDMLRPHEIADLFRKTKIVYLYENSAIAIEAVLCGCAAVFIPNEFLKEDEVHLARTELGLDGYALNMTQEEVLRAQKTVALGRENYLNSHTIFQEQLDNFIKTTQEYFGGNSYGVKSNALTGVEKVGGKSIIDNRYAKSNEFVGVIKGSRIVSDKVKFKTILRSLLEERAEKDLVRKIKLSNSDRRIIIKTKIIVKNKNFGRMLKKLIRKI